MDNVYLSKKEKQAIRSKDSIVTEVYYQRDKNYAHKDKDYEAVAYDSLNTMAAEMREQLLHIATACKNHLPPEVTLDFIPYDRILFRMVSGITKAVEDEIYKSRYARLNTPSDGFKKSVSMGGGFCGILNTITTLAMSSYLIEHDRPAPGFYAVDSSLTQLSEAEHKMQSETIHLFVEIPSKPSVSGFMGYLKGKSSTMLYEQFGDLKYKYRNREFWDTMWIR